MGTCSLNDGGGVPTFCAEPKKKLARCKIIDVRRPRGSTGALGHILARRAHSEKSLMMKPQIKTLPKDFSTYLL